MAVRLVKENYKKELQIVIPEKLSVCWKHIDGIGSVTAEEKVRLLKEFENPQAIILKLRNALKLNVPKK